MSPSAMPFGDLALVALIAYLIGSIPFGLIVTRLGGAGDIRKVGSGNIGATNVLRTGRRGLAAATLLLDAAKGALAVALAYGVLLAMLRGAPEAMLVLPVFGLAVAAVAVVVGHCFPVWLRFHGGKGVATGLGVALALDWRAGLACCVLWLGVARLSRISSAGALSAFAALPVLLLLLDSRLLALAGLIITLIVMVRHSANIRRLIDGTEPRIGRSKAPSSSCPPSSCPPSS